MAFVYKDRVRETTTTTGTGTLTLLGAVTGFQTFSAAIGNTNTTYYCIAGQGTSEWEVGLGTVSAGALARTIVLSSSNAGSAVTFSAGTKDVFCTQAAATIGDFPNGVSISGGDLLITGSGQVGYGTGSGGTVTQATSKSVGVTLNKPSGQITTHNASLAANTTVQFTLTNSFISSTDVVVVNQFTSANYEVKLRNTANGSVSIALSNITGSPLGQAVVIQFVVIKGATS